MPSGHQAISPPVLRSFIRTCRHARITILVTSSHMQTDMVLLRERGDASASVGKRS